MKTSVIGVAAAVIGACVFAPNAAAAQQFVYPAKGQSAEQQKKDEAECHQWAVQNTGVDPTKAIPAAPPPTPPTTATA